MTQVPSEHLERLKARALEIAGKIPNWKRCRERLQAEGAEPSLVTEAIALAKQEFQTNLKRAHQADMKRHQVLNRMLEGEDLGEHPGASELRELALEKWRRFSKVRATYRASMKWSLIGAIACAILLALLIVHYAASTTPASLQFPITVFFGILGCIGWALHAWKMVRTFQQRLDRLQAMAERYNWWTRDGPGK